MSNRRELSRATKESKKPKSVSKPEDKIYDPMGQWAHPGEITRIPGGNITMQGVPYPVYAVPQFGQPMLMYPGMNYNFPGSEYVDEYPLMYAQEGMTVPPSFEDRAKATNEFFYSNPIKGLKPHKLKEVPNQKQRPRLESGQRALIPGVTTLSEDEYEIVQMPEEYQGFPVYTTKTGNYFTLDPEYNKEYISPYIQKRFFGKDRTFYLPNRYLDRAQFQSGGSSDTDYISVNPLSVFGATPGLYTEGYERPTLDLTLGRRNMFPGLAKRSALEAISGSLTTSLPYQNNTGLGVHGNLKLVGDRWKNVEDVAKANVEVDLGAGYDPNMGPYARLIGSPQFTFGNVQPNIEKTYKGNLRAGEWLGKVGPYGGLSFTPGRPKQEERTSIGFGGRGNFAVGIGGGKTLGASGYFGVDPFGQATGNYDQSGLKGRTHYGFDVNLTIPFGTKQKQAVGEAFQNLFTSAQPVTSYRPMFMQEGGESFELELTDEEIEQYKKGGYIVEELPKAQEGLNVDPEMIYKDKYNTPLTPEEKVEFHKWVQLENKKQGRDILMDMGAYDLQGFWKSGEWNNRDSDGHGTDRYKKPNHPTFSEESMYSGQDGNYGGYWGEDGAYYPSAKTSDLYGGKSYYDWFFKQEEGRPEHYGGTMLPAVEVKAKKLPKAQQGTTRIDPSKARGRMSLLEKYEGDPTLFIPKPEVSESTQPKVVNRQAQTNAKKAVTETKQAVDAGAQMAAEAPHLTPEQKYEIITSPQKSIDFYNTQVTSQENQGSIERKKEQTDFKRAIDYMTNPGDALYYMMRGEDMPENYLEMRRAGIDPINDYYNAFGPSGGNAVLRGLDAAINPSGAAEAAYDISKGDYGSALMNLAMLVPAAKSFKYFDDVANLAKKTPLKKTPLPVKSKPSQWDNVYMPPQKMGWNPFNKTINDKPILSEYKNIEQLRLPIGLDAKTATERFPNLYPNVKAYDKTKKESKALIKKYKSEFKKNFGEGTDNEILLYGAYKDLEKSKNQGSFLANDPFAQEKGLNTNLTNQEKFLGDAYQLEFSEYFNRKGPNKKFSNFLADEFEPVITKNKLKAPAQVKRTSSFSRPVKTMRPGASDYAMINYRDLKEGDIIYPEHNWSTTTDLQGDVWGSQRPTSKVAYINLPEGQSGFRPNMYKNSQFVDEQELVLPPKLGYKVVGHDPEGFGDTSPRFIFDVVNPYEKGGSIEAELTPEEIQWYLDNGYNIDYL